MEFVNELLLSKDNISDQLKLLRKYKDNKYVQEYIKSLEEDKSLTGYVKYMIERYYYGKKDAIKCEKNCIERMFKVVLRPVKFHQKKYVETNIKVGDIVSIIGGPFKGVDGEVIKVDKEYAQFDVSINLFGEVFVVQVEFEFVIKKKKIAY